MPELGPNVNTNITLENHLQQLLLEADKLTSDLDRCSCDDKIWG